MSPVVDDVQYTARLAAVESVDVRSRVNGYLVKIDFEAGAEVPAGKLLFLVDPRPYKASLDAAVAHVAVGKARLLQLDSELARSKRLLPSGAISQEDFEKTVAQQAETVAGVEAAKAEEEKANLNVEFTEVKAPIAGCASRELITVGNLVTADQTLLTTIVKPDPIYAYFNVDELTVQRLLKAAEGGGGAGRGAGKPLRAIPRPPSPTPHPRCGGVLPAGQRDRLSASGTGRFRGQQGRSLDWHDPGAGRVRQSEAG